MSRVEVGQPVGVAARVEENSRGGSYVQKARKIIAVRSAATIALLQMLGAVPAVAQDGENIDVTIGWCRGHTGVFKTATNFLKLARGRQ